MKKLKSDSIAELDLSNYIHNALIANGISTISQLIEQSETNELYETLSKFHTKDFDEIESSLRKVGLRLYDKDKVLTRNKMFWEIGIKDDGTIRNKNGILWVNELISLTKTELHDLPEMTENLYNNIVHKVHENGLKFADELGEVTLGIEFKPIAILKLSQRPLGILVRRGYGTISKLINANIEDIKNLKGMGAVSLNEIIQKVHSLGLKFADEREEENTIVQNDIVEPINDTPSVSEQMNQSKLDKLARIQELQNQIIALQQEQSRLMQELNEELSKGDKHARQNK